MLMGQVAFNSGMAEELYKTARKFIGHVPGGLALATVVGATLFKAITTSSLATSATFSSVAIPEMDKYGYSRKLSTGVVASVGTLGFLIPPAGSMIIMAMLTEQSIGRLFLAGADSRNDNSFLVFLDCSWLVQDQPRPRAPGACVLLEGTYKVGAASVLAAVGLYCVIGGLWRDFLRPPRQEV